MPDDLNILLYRRLTTDATILNGSMLQAADLTDLAGLAEYQVE